MARITKYLTTCKCGCKGTDYSHKKTYERKLHQERAETGSCLVRAYRDPQRYDRVAFIHAPWCEVLVRVVRVVRNLEGKDYPMGWFVAD